MLKLSALVFLLLLSTLSEATAWRNGIPAASITCNFLTGVSTGAGGTVCVSPLPTCNGSADDASAFAGFNTWALAHQGSPASLIELKMPPGQTCCFKTLAGNTWSVGITKLRVMGYGNKISQCGASGTFPHFGAGPQISNVANASSRFNTVSAGATSITLITGTDESFFTAGQYIVIGGIDLQGASGFPPNPYIFEFKKLASVSSNSTGILTFTEPLKYSYKSTWPAYQGASGTPNAVWVGGPATAWTMTASFDTEQEYRGWTFDFETELDALGKSITVRDGIFPSCVAAVGAFKQIMFPTENLNFSMFNVSGPGCTMEVDKIVDLVTFRGLTVSSVETQSASVHKIDADRVTATSFVGTVQDTTYYNLITANINLGIGHYGVSNTFHCYTCSITANITATQTITEGSADSVYTMSGGVLSRLLKADAVNWAVPGGHYWFGVNLWERAIPFTVTDLTTDGTSVFIHTDLAGGFPAFGPSGSTNLAIRSHPMPNFSCSNCTGSADALDASQMTNIPYGTYTKRSYASSTQHAPFVFLIGTLVSYTATVTTPFGGGGALSYLLDQGSPNVITTGNAATETVYNAQIDLKTSSCVRTMTPTTTTPSGGCGADTNLTPPGPIWFATGIAPFVSSATAGAQWTVEIQTNQGF